jgi:hypothetical protein
LSANGFILASVAGQLQIALLGSQATHGCIPNATARKSPKSICQLQPQPPTEDQALKQEIPEKVLNELIAKIVSIQKRYAHELSGVRNDRRAEIKEALSQLVAERLEK